MNPSIQPTLHKLTIWMILFACLSIALPTAFMSIASGLFVIFWLLSGEFKSKLNTISQNPAGIATLILFGFYIIGVFYSSGPWPNRMNFLMKYDKLLFIPLIISVMHTEKMRRYGMNAFLIGMLLVLFVSYLESLGLPKVNDFYQQDNVVFKGRIAHNILMSFAAYLMLHRAWRHIGSTRWVWFSLGLLAIVDVMVLVNGRTGQVTMLCLIVLFIYDAWGKRALVYLGGTALLLIALNHIHPFLPHSRLTDTNAEISQHQNNGTQTSAGERVEMYTNTLSLIKRHPFFGGGTGSLEHEYQDLTKNMDTQLKRVPNPHNQFLLTTQELGLAGLICLLFFWYSHFKASFSLESKELSYALRGLVLTLFIGSLFNSLLLDAGEGKFYCVMAGVLLSAYQPRKTK